jgi:hypothetical protein
MATPQALLLFTVPRQPPPEDLGSAASTFLSLLYTDSDWIVVQRVLEQLSRDNSIEGVLRRQQETLLGIANSFGRVAPDPADVAAIQQAREEAQRSLTAELEATEEEIRARAPEMTEQLAEAVKAAEKAPADSPLAQAAARIARVADRAGLSKLGPYWAPIVLLWLIVHMTMGDIAALTLWYMVASDYFKKQD